MVRRLGRGIEWLNCARGMGMLFRASLWKVGFFAVSRMVGVTGRFLPATVGETRLLAGELTAVIQRQVPKALELGLKDERTAFRPITPALQHHSHHRHPTCPVLLVCSSHDGGLSSRFRNQGSMLVTSHEHSSLRDAARNLDSRLQRPQYRASLGHSIHVNLTVPHRGRASERHGRPGRVHGGKHGRL